MEVPSRANSIRGEHTWLRHAVDSDLDLLTHWFADPDVYLWGPVGGLISANGWRYVRFLMACEATSCSALAEYSRRSRDAFACMKTTRFP